MTNPRWFLTESAVNCFVFVRRYPSDNDAKRQAESELAAMIPAASFRQRDRYGRQLWRSPRRTGGALRWIVDPRPGAHSSDKRPRVIWVGCGAPPFRVWAP
jgi:hypothetical protein